MHNFLLELTPQGKVVQKCSSCHCAASPTAPLEMTLDESFVTTCALFVHFVHEIWFRMNVQKHENVFAHLCNMDTIRFYANYTYSNTNLLSKVGVSIFKIMIYLICDPFILFSVSSKIMIHEISLLPVMDI